MIHGCEICSNDGLYEHKGKWYCFPHKLALETPVTNYELEQMTQAQSLKG